MRSYQYVAITVLATYTVVVNQSNHDVGVNLYYNIVSTSLFQSAKYPTHSEPYAPIRTS